MDQSPAVFPTPATPSIGSPPVRRRVTDLTTGEQLVLWAFRQRLEGEAGEARVRQEFFSVCGLTGVEAAVQSFEGLVGALGGHARRVLLLHRAACPRLSPDEEMLLWLVAALQAEADALVDAQLCWLVARPFAQAVARQGGRFAATLATAGCRLPLRLPEAPSPKAPVRRALPVGARSSAGSKL